MERKGKEVMEGMREDREGGKGIQVSDEKWKIKGKEEMKED